MQSGGHNEMTALGDVASTLWRLRELLDTLLFKVVVQRLVLDSGQTRWLVNATRELAAALHEVQAAEVLRAAKVDRLADRLGVAVGSTLAELADAAPEPWATVLHEHRDALRVLVADVDAAAEAAELSPVRAVVADADGVLSDEVVRPVAMQTMARVRQRSLLDFLR